MSDNNNQNSLFEVIDKKAVAFSFQEVTIKSPDKRLNVTMRFIPESFEKVIYYNQSANYPMINQPTGIKEKHFSTTDFLNVYSYFLDKVKQKINDGELKAEEEIKDTLQRQLHDSEYTIIKDCPECHEQIKFPALNNPDDYFQIQAGNIYNSFWNDLIQGIKFCPECESKIHKQDGWRIQSMKESFEKALFNFYDDVQNGKANFLQMKIIPEKFNKSFRFRQNQEITNYKIQKVLNNLVDNDDTFEKYFIDFQSSDDSIIMNINIRKKFLKS